MKSRPASNCQAEVRPAPTIARWRSSKATFTTIGCLALMCLPVLDSRAQETESSKATQEAVASEEAFTKIFDGTSLTGWEGDRDWFRVESNAIVAGALDKPIPHNLFLSTEKEYGDFELRLSAKLIGDGHNAGIQFRSARIPNDHEVIGFQCDMGSTPERPIWGSLYDESRRRRFLSHPDASLVGDALKVDDWNQFRIQCESDRIRIWLNDVLLVDYIETDSKIAKSGIIALQIHGGPASEAWYKNIRIREIGNDS